MHKDKPHDCSGPPTCGSIETTEETTNPAEKVRLPSTTLGNCFRLGDNPSNQQHRKNDILFNCCCRFDFGASRSNSPSDSVDCIHVHDGIRGGKHFARTRRFHSRLKSDSDLRTCAWAVLLLYFHLATSGTKMRLGTRLRRISKLNFPR